jgi:hypothetical protein
MGHLQKGLNVFGSNVLAQCGSVGLGWSKPPCRSSTATHSVMHRRYALNSPGQEPKSRFFDSYVTVHIVHVEHVHVNEGGQAVTLWCAISLWATRRNRLFPTWRGRCCARTQASLAPLAFVSPRVILDIADGVLPPVTVTELAKTVPYAWSAQLTRFSNRAAANSNRRLR